jgi:hypothetical protein
LHDGVELEDRGIRTVVLTTPDFVNSFHVHAKAEGRTDDYQPVIVDTVAILKPDEIINRADKAIDSIVAALTGEKHLSM